MIESLHETANLSLPGEVRPRGIKRYIPSSLFGRALLILAIPTVVVQLLAVYMFYERHWDSVVRNMSASLAGEIALLLHQIRQTNDEEERLYWQNQAEEFMGFKIAFLPHTPDTPLPPPDPRFNQFKKQMRHYFGTDFTVYQLGYDGNIRVIVRLPDSTVQMEVSKKRLVSSTTYIFVLWMAGTALALLIVAIVFLRNQVRPITQLAHAAEGFGLGQDNPEFHPAGAREVRQAARAFITMRARIRRQIATRTAMLSGISHDLRTPLTRMKLQLALLKDQEAVQALRQDVEEMERMVQEYLDFVRGEEGEESSPVDLNALIVEAVEGYRRAGQKVQYELSPRTDIRIRPRLFRRALDNLIGNALRYGASCRVRLSVKESSALITVEDAGPGIPEESFDLVFRPFRRLEESRNLDTGGVGLGLTIAQDIIRAHGGDIALKNLTDDAGKITGLQVRVRLPLGSS